MDMYNICFLYLSVFIIHMGYKILEYRTKKRVKKASTLEDISI